jgi:hypothetical protein
MTGLSGQKRKSLNENIKWIIGCEKCSEIFMSKSNE